MRDESSIVVTNSMFYILYCLSPGRKAVKVDSCYRLFTHTGDARCNTAIDNDLESLKFFIFMITTTCSHWKSKICWRVLSSGEFMYLYRRYILRSDTFTCLVAFGCYVPHPSSFPTFWPKGNEAPAPAFYQQLQLLTSSSTNFLLAAAPARHQHQLLTSST